MGSTVEGQYTTDSRDTDSRKIASECCSREMTVKERLELKIKQKYEDIEGLKALISNLPTNVNERDDRSIRRILEGKLI